MAVLFRSDRPQAAVSRLEPVVAALARLGAAVDLLEFADDRPALVRDQLLAREGVLVWADPVTDAGDRTTLDDLLRDVSSGGVQVSAHPNVIDKIGTKEVLHSTRILGWGTDTHLYQTAEQFQGEFPARLAADRIRVIKTTRGNGGSGVWKVRLLEPASVAVADADAMVAVQHAKVRDNTVAAMQLGDFMVRAEVHFRDWGSTGRLVDQAFCASITRGIVRCYLVGDRVVGFARQRPRTAGSAESIMGLPSAKTMYAADEPEFRGLRGRLEAEWVPGMCALLGLTVDHLPVLWDADFLYGDTRVSPEGEGWVLCEINASSILPFPPSAPDLLARRALNAIRPGSI